MDLLKSKRKLLDLTKLLTENCLDGKPILGGKPVKNSEKNKGWPNFQEIFMISAFTGKICIQYSRKNHLQIRLLLFQDQVLILRVYSEMLISLTSNEPTQKLIRLIHISTTLLSFSRASLEDPLSGSSYSHSEMY